MAYIVLTILLAVCIINATIAYHFKRHVLGYFTLSLLMGVTGPGPVVVTIVLMCLGHKTSDTDKSNTNYKEM